MAASVDKAFLLSALRAGFSSAQIAESLNVTQSAVDQLINAYDLRAEAAKNSRFESIDNKLNTIEEAVLVQLEKQVKFVQDPMKLVRVLQVVNGARRRSTAEGNRIPTDGARLVQLRLPDRINVNVTINARNEVIAVNGRVLDTAAPNRVLEHIKEEDANHASAITPVAIQRLQEQQIRDGITKVADLL